MKKQLIFIIIFLLLVGLIGGLLVYRQRQAKWQAYKKTIENQKAEEITIRIIEGWSNQEIAEYLDKQGIVTADIFLKSTLNYPASEYKNQLPPEALTNLQGFLYPNTYRLFKSITNKVITPDKEAAQTVIKKLLTEFFNKLPNNAENLARQQGLSLYQAITLASIIEKETGRNALTAVSKQSLDEERKIIAGIFYNRLKIKMALQSDATINYITGKNDPSATLADLEIDSPYNTYKYSGLPPTPIANPSLSSIVAVLNPTKTDYLYFLHKQPTGEPVYAKTFDEHVQNKLKYLK
jgi:UPF0755 protein